MAANGDQYCKHCQRHLSPFEFGHHTRKDDGRTYRNTYCKTCTAARSRRRQFRLAIKDPEYYQKRGRKNNAKARRIRQDQVRSNIEVAQRVIDVMREKGFPLKVISQLTGVNYATVRSFTKGRYSQPYSAARIASLIRCATDAPEDQVPLTSRIRKHKGIAFMQACLERKVHEI